MRSVGVIDLVVWIDGDFHYTLKFRRMPKPYQLAEVLRDRHKKLCKPCNLEIKNNSIYINGRLVNTKAVYDIMYLS